MCTFCTEHGRDDKWYFNFENFLFNKVFPTPEDKEAARAHYLHTLGDTDRYADPEYDHDLEYAIKKHKTAPGQVITQEEAMRILELAGEATKREDTMVTLARCNCLLTFRGKIDYRCIVFGVPVSWASEIGYARYPREGLTEFKGAEWSEIRRQMNEGRRAPLEIEEAKEMLQDWGKRGLHHTVVSRGLLPLIDGLCNCEAPYCNRLRQRRVLELPPAMLKGHFIARIEPESCNGCAACMTKCDFGAIHASKSEKITYIDPAKCFGCGVCRLACSRDAITMVPREDVPASRGQW